MALREGGPTATKRQTPPDQGTSRIGKPIRRSVRGDHIPNTVCTILFLNLAIVYKLGARSLEAIPSNHLDSQKGVFFPLPTCIVVEAKSSCLSFWSETFRSCFQGFSFRSHWCHNHLNLSALPNLSKSFIPKPPHLLGLKQVSQFTRQCPLLTLSGFFPFQRKLILNLSALAIAHFCILCTDRR
jgi:hypothetical protein